ncbi:hypothetical protein SADUNF_Sadunf04G0104400 [Salix dunnii]|uniref:Small ribosomal subunit protein uS7 domain-containing protein n=1 Tax=Salix dunnii TaxID=1413687 RepID=A0A835N2V8_9ROSI|nr:hypothetical protein SADUNF_Sadunf04G0104400 [Salix dunnii]
MASTSMSFCSPPLTSSRASVLHHFQQLNPNRLSFPINLNTAKRAPNNTVQHAPLPLKVLCGRGKKVNGVTPDVAVKARRVGGSTHQVPIEVGTFQGKALAIRWLLEASRKRQGRSMVLKLSSEVMDAAKGNGEAIKKKETTHKMAEANRAFVHFR